MSDKITPRQALLPQHLHPRVQLCTSMPIHTPCSLEVIALLQASSRFIVFIVPYEKYSLAVACRVMHIVMDNAVHGETTPQLYAYGWVNKLTGEDFSDILFYGHHSFIDAKTLEESAGHVAAEVETADHVPARLIQPSGNTAPAVGG